MTGSKVEFFRPMAVDSLPAGGRTFSIVAGREECAALARRFGLIGIDSLEAEGAVIPSGRTGEVRLEGRLRAAVVQSCVVTLDPFGATIDVPFETIYSRWVVDEWADAELANGDLIVESTGESFLEPLEGDIVDVGEAVAQHLSLALDPYPRKPDATFVTPKGVGAEEEGPPSPFAVLRGRQTGGEPPRH